MLRRLCMPQSIRPAVPWPATRAWRQLANSLWLHPSSIGCSLLPWQSPAWGDPAAPNRQKERTRRVAQHNQQPYKSMQHATGELLHGSQAWVPTFSSYGRTPRALRSALVTLGPSWMSAVGLASTCAGRAVTQVKTDQTALAAAVQGLRRPVWRCSSSAACFAGDHDLDLNRDGN